MIKKILAAVAGGSVLAVLVPAITFAAPNPTATAVSGTVTHNGSPVAGANVTVNCVGNVLTDVTDAAGGYEVDYMPASLCPAEATASVSATLGDLSGSNSGPVGAVTSNLNVALVDVAVVPEMGVMLSIGAAFTGAGAFMVIRRRAAQNV